MIEKQIRPEPDFYAKQYMILSCKMENAIMLIEMGQSEKAKELLKFALIRAEEDIEDYETELFEQWTRN